MIYIGKYNLDFCGKAGKREEYDVLIISEFNGDTEIDRRVLYIQNADISAMSNMTELEVNKLMQYPNYAIINVKIKMNFERIG